MHKALYSCNIKSFPGLFTDGFTNSEDNEMTEHLPFPTPVRAIYGFVLYVVTYLLFGLYVLWAFLPDHWLGQLGITYLPQRYWVFAGPVYGCVSLVFAVWCYISWNLLNTPSHDSMATITDQYARKLAPENLLSGQATRSRVLPLGDVDICTVTRYLHLENSDKNIKKHNNLNQVDNGL